MPQAAHRDLQVRAAALHGADPEGEDPRRHRTRWQDDPLDHRGDRLQHRDRGRRQGGHRLARRAGGPARHPDGGAPDPGARDRQDLHRHRCGASRPTAPSSRSCRARTACCTSASSPPTASARSPTSSRRATRSRSRSINIDEQGKIRLSRKAVIMESPDYDPSQYEGMEMAMAGGGGERERGGERRWWRPRRPRRRPWRPRRLPGRPGRWWRWRRPGWRPRRRGGGGNR